jgi:TPP-dependent pyruvate/acetoin dehydrogenase alpha subunit
LPVLFLCENNRYSMGMAVEKAEAEPDIYKKAAAYHIPGEAVDGMDVHAVEAAATAAAKAIRDGGGPRLLEFKTYRFRAHSMFDPELYRDKAEVAAWKEKGPVLAFEQQLRDTGLLEEDALAALEAEIAAEIDDAIQFAEASAWEPVETITRDVYAEEARP